MDRIIKIVSSRGCYFQGATLGNILDRRWLLHASGEEHPVRNPFRGWKERLSIACGLLLQDPAPSGPPATDRFRGASGSILHPCLRLVQNVGIPHGQAPPACLPRDPLRLPEPMLHSRAVAMQPVAQHAPAGVAISREPEQERAVMAAVGHGVRPIVGHGSWTRGQTNTICSYSTRYPPGKGVLIPWNRHSGLGTGHVRGRRLPACQSMAHLLQIDVPGRHPEIVGELQHKRALAAPVRQVPDAA